VAGQDVDRLVALLDTHRSGAVQRIRATLPA
jgi:hypothetical protein